ncbi:MAG: metallophosphoesterase family protein [Candidatus Brocadiae bacterium]|nr:metallophosphoesterase family protein [Candidatus Brocadiia bacterium]
MKYAILGDVHGNLEALEAVLAQVRAAKPDRIVHLGDIVGYGASPVECWDLVRDAGARGIVGNHERYVTGVTSMASVSRDDKRFTIDYSAKRMKPAQLEEMKRMPLQIATEDGLLFVHGSPRNEDEYLLTWEAVQESVLFLRMTMPEVHVCFFGHTHIPALATATAVESKFEEKPDVQVIQLADSKTYLVNPGSVGQPRDRCAKAAWALYDSGEDVLEFRRVAYDVGGAQNRMRDAGFADPLVDRLAHGR